jgi:putative two-component system response regulator
MSKDDFIGDEMDSLVEKLKSTKTDIKLAWDIVKVTEAEKQDLQAQLFRYAEDMHKLIAERDLFAIDESEKKAAYSQLERFNRDFMLLMKQKEKSYKALELSHLDTIRYLAAAAEFKDDDTGEHIVRMSRFSYVIARAYGQDENYCSLLEQASPMHDIGKIGIPDNVLKKPGKLTEQEWECMRKHPEYGANILSGSEVPLIQMAAEVALTHHEKFDGSGYPSKLIGDQIPLSGRIVALADFFDAVTMDRCYRPAFSDEEALNMVIGNSGTHFDPDVVKAFLSVSDEIINERNKINNANITR